MRKFSQKIIKEALRNLSKNVRESLNDQLEDIEDYLNNIAEEQEKEMEALKKHVDNLIHDGALAQDDREKSCVLPLLTVEATEQVCEILGKKGA